MEMPNAPLETFIRSLPLFSLVEWDELVDILRLLHPVALNEGDVLFRQGSTGNAMWILSEPTRVSLSLDSKEATDTVTLAESHGGQTVGEMTLVDDGGRSATATVSKGGPAYRIEATEFHALKDSQRSAAYKVLRRICFDLCGKLRETNDRLAPPSESHEGNSGGLTQTRAATTEDVARFEPFRSFPEVVKLALMSKMKVVELQPDEVLFKEGDAGDFTYFIIGGEILVKRGESILTTLGPSRMVGLLACVDGRPRSATVSTKSGAQLLSLARRDFDFLFSQRNRIVFQLVEMIARQLVEYIRATNEKTRQPSANSKPASEEEELNLLVDLAFSEA